ncbi:MAG: hypothetical protein K2N82_09470 [Lachnospiraceae bacterium]|nr:hypothetical protein [Lachnospiraceae bacterium]
MEHCIRGGHHEKEKGICAFRVAVIAVWGVGISLLVIKDQRQPVDAALGHQEGMVQESDDLVGGQEIIEDDLAIFIPN